jgi:protein-L-isoaspartate(D-aspartate) O-methyltransferase
LGLILLVMASPVAAGQEDPWLPARERMMKEIRDSVADTRHWIDRETLDPGVMASMGSTPRHLFVPEDEKRRAYENRPLPIGYGQTISQPYIVALMTDLIDPKPSDRVLEVGTGSGYQAAVLSPLVSEVYTIEIIPQLGIQAKDRLAAQGYDNVRCSTGDGYYGWPEAAPFDAIIVTAVAGQVPPPLVAQLKPGGTMVIPVGHRFGTQHLMLVVKQTNGELVTRQVLPVRFVPLTGNH